MTSTARSAAGVRPPGATAAPMATAPPITADLPGATAAPIAADPQTAAAPPAFTPPVAVVPGRLGVLGGTFDPIHLGHLAIADEAREVLGLERLLLVPAGQPPHKPGIPITPAADRAAMVELAIAGLAGLEASRVELDRPGPSFAVDTIAALAAAERAAGREPDLWFVLSTEALAGLASWRDPERLLELCRLAVVPREGHPPPDPGWLGARFPGREERVTWLDGPRIRVSASEIRARVAAGRSIRFLVPPAVSAYIGDHGLYRVDSRRPPAS